MVCGPGNLDTVMQNGMESSEPHTSFSLAWRADMLFEGCRLMVEMPAGKNKSNRREMSKDCLSFEEEVHSFSGEAEILTIKTDQDGHRKFYVHFSDCNRRLDEWVDEARLDLRTVIMPTKIKKNQHVPVALITAMTSDERESR